MSVEGADQVALSRIDGPDEDGCVLICSAGGRHVRCQNPGPTDVVAEAMCQWLGAIDHGKRE